jgi:hypothetical protein
VQLHVVRKRTSIEDWSNTRIAVVKVSTSYLGSVSSLVMLECM